MKNSQDIAHKMIELAPLMIRTVKAEIQAAAEGRITHPQYRILANLHRGLNTVGQIASNQGVSQPAMSKMVDHLVKKGLVLRTQQGTDRRQVQLKLSTKGKTLFRELKFSAAQSLGEQIKKIPDPKETELAKALSEIANFLQNLKALKEEKP